jgi:L-ascorbate metabolism protein UlaG (beta-lactamase superfamily)
MKKIIYLSFALFVFTACKNTKKEKTEKTQEISAAVESEEKENSKDSVTVMPVEHASFTMKLNNKVLYFDPVGGAEKYTNLPKPDLIFVTDIHGDHMNIETLEALVNGNEDLKIICPLAVKEKIPESLQDHLEVIKNDEEKTWLGIQVKAIPMYNLREEAKDFHVKGRGNGYLLTFNDEKIYISGDTEDIPEMRNLKDIDLAFVCMNLPYTMPVDAAADAVLDFKPKKVYPYHYRGKEGFSDVEKFKNIVNTNNPNISVEILKWYE